jgi:hypothetical protein
MKSDDPFWIDGLFSLKEGEVMRAGAAFCLLVLALILFTPESSFAFRCGAKLITVGDRKAEVVSKCGPPDWQDSWQEQRIERVFVKPHSFKGPFSGTRVPIATVVQVTIDEWTYNLGPSYFIRILRFENNILKDIETGDYGF